MNVEQLKRQAVFSWAAVGVFAALCGVLAILQYKWVGRVTRAEQERYQKELLASLKRLSTSFQTQIQEASSALRPTAEQIDSDGREGAYAARYRQWKASGQSPIFRSIALAVPKTMT